MTDLNLTFGSEDIVEYGKPLRPSALAEPPAVVFALEPDRSSMTLHTLLMVDPDAPFRDTPTEGEWVHWLVYDIPGNHTALGKTLVEYAAPKPRKCPKNERLCLKEHRITFILWEQPHGPIDLQPEDTRLAAAIAANKGQARAGYKARDFAARHRLGLHIGLNFLETWHDPNDGSFYQVPWYHVRDESLGQVSHLVPHVERPRAASKAASKTAGKASSKAAKKDEL